VVNGSEEIAFVDPGHELPAIAGSAAEAKAHQSEQHVEDPAMLGAHHHGAA
jgi:hypothetical protein